jgi:hypothetical protein
VDTPKGGSGYWEPLLFIEEFMTKRKPIDVDELKKTFRINNGKLERIDLRRTDGKWKVVDNKKNSGNGYCQVGFNGRMVQYHNIVWILSTGKDIPQGMEIDHINGNTIDNRIENLRLVTNRRNQQNQKKHREGQLFGCYFNKSMGKYQTQIKIGGKIIYLGRYKTEQEAHEAYKIACKYIAKYTDNDSFRELIKKEMEK